MKQTILIMIVLFSTLVIANPPVVSAQDARDFCAIRYSQRDNPQGFIGCVRIVMKYGYIIK